VSRVCAELRERFEAFKRRSLYDVNLVVLFLDAIYLPVRPSGPKEDVICAWRITEGGERALVSVRLGMREAKEDRVELGRDLTSRGLAAPRLVVPDGPPGLISAVEEIPEQDWTWVADYPETGEAQIAETKLGTLRTCRQPGSSGLGAV
jgi:putative transposase